MIRVADYIIERLYEEGVKNIFSITGRGILYLSDAVAKFEKIKNISMHHEQAAAFAATANAQYTEKIGACLVSTGCASTNTITGVLEAWQDGIPCIFISGQNILNETVNYTKIPIRTYGSQETNIIPIVKSITKYATMITSAEQIAYELDKAFYYANSERKGPVWIDIPINIQNMRIEPEKLERYIPEEKKENFNYLDTNIEEICQAINTAKRPILLIGSGVRTSNSKELFYKFVEKTKIPVTYAHTATDLYGLENPLSIGTVGSLCGTRAGNFAVQNSDLLLILGCRLSSMTTGEEYEKFARAAKIIVIDIDKIEHSKRSVQIDKLLIVDIKYFLTSILDKKIKTTSIEWQEKCLHWKNIFPKCEDKYKNQSKVDLYRLAEGFTNTLPENSVFLCDAGLEELILPSNISFKKNMRCIHSPMQGAMGFALPGTIGIASTGNKNVIAVIGDGSIMMNLQELETIRYHQFPIKIFVINNNIYSIIRKRQQDLFRTRTIGTDSNNGVSCPNFKKIAECFDMTYIKIETSKNLEEQLSSILQLDSSVLCEIIGVENQEYICNSYARNQSKKIVRRPLEDQAPFLDRELFLSEMIIEPIDQ